MKSRKDEFIRYAAKANGLDPLFIDNEIKKDGTAIINAFTKIKDLLELSHVNPYAACQLIRVFPDAIAKMTKTREDSKNLLTVYGINLLQVSPELLKFLNISDLKILSKDETQTLIFILKKSPKAIGCLLKTAQDVLAFCKMNPGYRDTIADIVEKNAPHITDLFQTADDFIQLAAHDHHFIEAEYHKATVASLARYDACDAETKRRRKVAGRSFNLFYDSVPYGDFHKEKKRKSIAYIMAEQNPKQILSLFQDANQFIELVKADVAIAHSWVLKHSNAVLKLFGDNINMFKKLALTNPWISSMLIEKKKLAEELAEEKYTPHKSTKRV